MKKLPSLLALLVALASVPAGAQSVLVDESTGKKFETQQTVDGVSFRCLGAGVRKKFVVKVYAVAYCIEADKVDDTLVDYIKKNHPGEKGEKLADALEDDQHFYDALYTGPGGKLIIMKLARDITKDQIAGAFEDSLSEVLPKDKVAKLIATIPSGAKEGEKVLIYSKGSTLVIDIAGNKKEIDDAMIAEQIWRVWLGPDSVSGSLKDSIAEQVGNHVK